MNAPKPPLYLIDSYGLIYRSYFAFLSRPLRNAAGHNISALFGFCRNLVALLDEGGPAALADGTPSTVPVRPLRLAAVFDSRVPTFRHERYAEYKATRQKTPDDLHAQVPLVEEALAALGVKMLRTERYEADDLIATLAERCKREGRGCYVISSDKDLLQLVGDGVYQLRPGKSGPAGTANGGIKGGANYEFVGPEEVKAEWGVPPKGVLDILSLIGDASDNVPGVKGVGEKTAVKLMARYGSLDEIYANIAGIEGAVGKKLAEGKESAYFSRELIELEKNAPVEVDDIDTLTVENLDRAACARVLLREGVRLVAQSLSPETVKEWEKAGASRPDAAAGAERPAADARAADEDGTGTEPASSGVKAAPLKKKPQTGLFDGSDTAAGAPDEFQGPPRPQSTDELRASGRYATILKLADLDALLARAKAKGVLALDFETDSLDAWTAKPVGLSLAVDVGEGFYLPVAAHASVEADGSGGSAPFVDPAEVRKRIGVLLADPDMTVVAHNAKYDYEVSRGWGLPRWKCRIWDTMVAAWLIDPERSSFTLDSLCASWLGLETVSYDTIVPKGATFDVVPLATATRYSGEDVDLALRMKALIEPCLQAAGEAGLLRDIEMPLLPILAEMEGVGIKIEGDVLRSYGIELAEELKSIEAQIYKLVGHEFNIASTKQLQEVLFVERKLKTGKKTKTGYSTDVAVLEELAREDPVPERILRYRMLSKLKSTYVDALAGLAGADGRLHTHYAQAGTATGRLSSRDPNLQNIPIREEEGRRIRAAFVAEPGKILVSADYSQIELVVLAHLSGDAELCAAFLSGQDVHRRTAALIFGLKEDEVSSDQRRAAKTINFGVMYGMSAFRLSNELGIPRSEAQAFIDAYFHTYAGVRAYIDGLIVKTERTGYATTLLGRRRYIPAIRSSNKTEKSAAERVAVNTPIQGSAADIVKLAMLRVDRALIASKLKAKLLLQVHDELIFECDEADAEKLMVLVKEEMEKAASLRIPLRASVEKAKSWGEMH